MPLSNPYSTWGIVNTASAGITVKGTLQSITNLPNNALPGDTYIIHGVMYSWLISPSGAANWANMGALGSDNQIMPRLIESKLTWKGISVTLKSEADIKSLFLNQYCLEKEDMAMFQMTYPEEFRDFRQKWAEKWAIETAKDQFDSWSEDYYEKKPRRNYQ